MFVRESKRECVDISGASDWAGRRYSLNFQIPKGYYLLFPLLAFPASTNVSH